MPAPSSLPEQGRHCPEAREQAEARSTTPGLGLIHDIPTTGGSDHLLSTHSLSSNATPTVPLLPVDNGVKRTLNVPGRGWYL